MLQVTKVVRWYAETTPDPMMANPPGWFKPLVVGELLFQLPFFFMAVSKIPKGISPESQHGRASFLSGVVPRHLLKPTSILALNQLNPTISTLVNTCRR
jgi:hypothetical protein